MSSATLFVNEVMAASHIFGDFVDRGSASRSIEDDLAARHRDNSVTGLEHVVHVVADEDPGEPLAFQRLGRSQ